MLLSPEVPQVFAPLCFEEVNSLLVFSIVVYTVNHKERNSFTSQNESPIVVYAVNHAIVVFAVNIVNQGTK